MTSRKTDQRKLHWKIVWLFICLIILFSQLSALTKLQPKKKILSNGLELIYQTDPSSAITVLQILIKGGKGAEPEDKHGLAYLTTRLTVEIPDFSKVRELMNQASQVYWTSKADYSFIHIVSLSENLENTLKISTEILLKPLFSSIRIDRIKKQMTYQKKREEDDAIKVGHSAVLEKLFAGTSYGGPFLGSEDTLKSIKKRDIQDFYNKHFNAKNMIISAISDLEEEKLTGILERYLLKIPSGEPLSFKQKLAQIPEEKSIFIEKDTKQFYISLAFPLPEITPKNYALAYMTETLLGKGVSSRLWFLRTKEKLAYNINCVATQMIDGGMLEAYIETDKDKKDVALKALRKTLNQLYEEGISEEELAITKTYSIASFLMDNETKANRASNLAYYEAINFGYEFLNRFDEEIGAISLEEMNAYIKERLDPEKAVEIIVGPKEEPQLYSVPIISSRSSTFFGMDLPRILCPSSMTSTLSSIRIPPKSL